jgi:type II secretory pathway pseudopilin PulG
LTIVELLVATAALAVVMAMALAMMMQSEEVTRRVTERQTAIQECRNAMMSVGDLVSRAVPPENLTALSNPAGVNPIFGADRLSLVVYDEAEGGFLNQWTVKPRGAGDAARDEPILEWRPIAETVGGQESRGKEDRLLKAIKGDWHAEMRFAYARAAAPGGEPDYQDTFPGGEWPDLVRITIRAETTAPGRGVIEMTTAAIPGGLAASRRASEAQATTSATITVEPAAGDAASTSTMPAMPGAMP